jgi:hypothetical protein
MIKNEPQECKIKFIFVSHSSVTLCHCVVRRRLYLSVDHLRWSQARERPLVTTSASFDLVGARGQDLDHTNRHWILLYSVLGK